MRRFLKLHHHKHTGKLIHHRHTSYGSLFAVLIAGGVILTALTASTFTVKADDIEVTAVVPAPIPSGAPVFTAPDDGYETTSPAVQFNGTCPIATPAVVIGLYEGSTLLGSGACGSSGTFSVVVQLTGGTHTVVATVITITDGTGDSSMPLHVTYTPPVNPVAPVTPTTPVSPTSPTSSGAGGDTLAPILQITATKPFVLFRPHIQTTWSGSFSGGSAPYRVRIDWGDGTSDTYTSSEAGSYHHTYTSGGAHTLIVTITDQSGYSLSRRFAAVDTTQPTSANQVAVMPTFIDRVSSSPAMQILVIYSAVFILLMTMWRYEIIHHRRVIGVPTHYNWQHVTRRRKL